MITLTLIAALLSVDPRPPRLSPAIDTPGSWVAIHATRPETPYTARILAYSTDTITVAGAVLPKLVEVRRPGGDATWIRNPLYVGGVEMRTADLELTYFDGTTFLGACLVSGEFPLTEDGAAYHDEIRREIQRRVDSGSLWQTSNTGIRETSGVYLDSPAALPMQVSATRVAYRVYVPDAAENAGAELGLTIAAARVEATLRSEVPSIPEGRVEELILREVQVPAWRKVSLRGVVEKAP